MEAIDSKIIKELETLSTAAKHKVLAFIKGLKAGKASKYAPADDFDQTSLSDNLGDNTTKSEFLSTVQSLPAELQAKLLKYLEILKAKANKASEETEQPANPKKKPSKFKPGFGGAKGLIILKKGWDEPLTDLFEDYT